jgi:hypothetical protein
LGFHAHIIFERDRARLLELTAEIRGSGELVPWRNFGELRQWIRRLRARGGFFCEGRRFRDVNIKVI